ncbi:MAG: hypothetical protein GC179_20615 [Anaerolineaceae bacterium]|nr:hypothetical protein [Anaerolineaceae bacterium]
MGCRAEWADDDHLIMDLYVEVPWDWEEFMLAVDATFSKLRTLGKPCATTVDVTRMGSFPKGNVLRYLTEIEKAMPQNVFASALVGAPYTLTIFMDIMMKIRPRAQRIALFTKTREEAHQKIRDRYAKMSGLPTNEKAS